ncbi:MAG: MFS transporter [Oscillospiraceae bacterium]|nr:MFS transporter [Oscillospiraceae bacterium]
MVKNKKLLTLTVMAIALIQMPTLALNPAIQQIQANVFPAYTLAQVQTAMSLSSFVSPCMAIVSAIIVNNRLVTKRNVLATGLFTLAFTGILALLLHTEFWHLIVLSVVLGCASGLFLSNAFGLIFDYFEANEREAVAGYQTSCVNIGGILMGIVGGVLAKAMWYGGYLVLLLGLPVGILVLISVPNRKVPEKKKTGEKRGVFAGITPRVFYYSITVMFFMMVYTVCGSNLSTHIKDFGDSVAAGFATSCGMVGGVVSGIVFGKVSQKFKDWTQVIATMCIVIGLTILSFAKTMPLVYVGVFINGLALSLMMPRCIFCVSTLVDESTSATATTMVSSVCPSLGGFLSPVVFTNLTVALGGNSTVFRYRFVACVVLAFAIFLAIMAVIQTKKGTMIDGTK